MKINRPLPNKKQLITNSLLYKTGLILLIILWLISVCNVIILPEIIPVHFNGAGIADRYDSKSTLLLLAAIATIIFSFIKYLTNHPHLLNYPVQINAANAQRQYTTAQIMLTLLNICISSIFILLNVETYLIVNKVITDLGIWFLPGTIAIITFPVIWLTIRSIFLR